MRCLPSIPCAARRRGRLRLVAEEHVGQDGEVERDKAGEMSCHLRSIYLVQRVLIFAGAVTIAATEKIPIGDAIYFAFVTALTIGYGDIVEHLVTGRVVSVLFGIVGILFTGLIVAIGVRAVREACEQTQHPD